MTTTAGIAFASKLQELGRNSRHLRCSSSQLQKGQTKAGILILTGCPTGYAGLPFVHTGRESDWVEMHWRRQTPICLLPKLEETNGEAALRYIPPPHPFPLPSLMWVTDISFWNGGNSCCPVQRGQVFCFVVFFFLFSKMYAADFVSRNIHHVMRILVCHICLCVFTSF